MSTKLEKVLLVMLIVSVIGIPVIMTSFLCEENKEHYEINEELYGDPRGRDFGGAVGDGLFQMWHIAGEDGLYIADGTYSANCVLKFEYKHKYDGHDLYYYSADGYAVVYAKSNLCKVLITEPPEEMLSKVMYRENPEDNYRIRKLVGEEYKCIIYLDSFDEFTLYEQKILKELKEKQDKDDKVTEFLIKPFELLDKLDKSIIKAVEGNHEQI